MAETNAKKETSKTKTQPTAKASGSKGTGTEQKTKKVFSQEDGVLCKSVTSGGLSIEGPKTGMHYRFPSYGSENEIEYRDLIGILRLKREFLFNPNIVVEDEDFIAEQPQLKKFYEEQYTVDDLRDLLTLPSQTMIDQIKLLPKSAINNIKSVVATEVASGNLDSVSRIKALDEFFGTELSLLADIKE